MAAVHPHIKIYPQKTLIHLYTHLQSASAHLVLVIPDCSLLSLSPCCMHFFSSSTCSFKDTVVALRSIFTTGDSRRLQKLSTAASAIFRPQSVRFTPRTGPRREREKKKKGMPLYYISKMGKRFPSFLYFLPLRFRKRPRKDVDKTLEGSMVCK